ncbi:MAG: efflux RND transporter periplasmic adaptor subunit [Pirellulales bacterium]|jgi:RND family efflux transporter MFP subunit
MECKYDTYSRFSSVCLVLAGGLAVCLVLTGCTKSSSHEGLTSAKQPSTSNSRVEVVTAVQKDVVHTTSQPATVHPFFQADIISKVSGYIEDVFVDIGDAVKSGDALCQLSVPEMGKQLDQIHAKQQRLLAELKRAEAAVNVAVARIRSSEAEAEEAASNIKQVEARLIANKAELKRVVGLVERKAVTIANLDEAQASNDVSEAEKISAEAALRSAQAKKEIAVAEQEAAQAEVATAQARHAESIKEGEELEAMLQYTTICAPFDGVVTSRSVDPGDFVTGTSQAHGLLRRPLFHVDQQSRLRIRVAIPERDASEVDAGDPVVLRLDALPKEPIDAVVTRAAQRLDPSTRTMLAEIEVDNARGQLLPGMFGCATIIATTSKDAIVLPASALRADAEGNPYVFLLDDQDRIVKKHVVVGADDGHEIEVVTGLVGTERVVDAFVGSIEEGQVVEVVRSE